MRTLIQPRFWWENEHKMMKQNSGEVHVFVLEITSMNEVHSDVNFSFKMSNLVSVEASLLINNNKLSNLYTINK